MSSDGQYDLDILLELRQKERQNAEASYAEALQHYHQAGEILRRAEEEHHQLVEKRRHQTREFDRTAVTGESNLAGIQRFEYFLEGLRDLESQALQTIERARGRQQVAQQKMRRSHEAMLEAIKGLKAVEKHHEAWKEEQKILEERRASNQMDEIAARLWQGQQP